MPGESVEQSTVKDEINFMIDTLNGTNPQEVKEEEEVKEEVKEEVNEVKEELKEEVIEKKEEVVVDEKDKLIEDLRRQLNEKADVKPVVKEEVKEVKEEVKEEPLKLDDQDFIGDLDLDDLTRDKTAFNKILNTVYSKGVADARRLASENVLRNIPDIVKHNITLLNTLEKASNKFYDDNKDLVPFKKVVAAVFEEIAAAHPEKKYNEVMELVAPDARKRLGLQEQVHKKEQEKKEDRKGPKLPQSKSGPRASETKPDTSSLQAEIEEMNKTIRR